MLLFFDTETTGLVRFDLPPDHPGQPHLVQLAAILTTIDGKEVSSFDLTVKAEGYQIPEQAARIHGITTELSHKFGVGLQLAVAAFVHLRSLADTVVAHNLPFDERVIDAAIARVGRKVTMHVPEGRACTLEMAEPVLRLPATEKMKAAGYGDRYKKPNLGECIRGLFGEELTGAHNAIVDVRACARVYFELKRRERGNV